MGAYLVEGQVLRMAAWLISHHSHTAKGYSRT
jgi:hypothetical protein